MGNSLILFASSYVAVLLFGFQSQIVRDKHAIVAFFTSMLIGLSQLAFFKFVPDASFWECVFWIFGGMCGIVSSIYVHNAWLKFVPPKKHSKAKPIEKSSPTAVAPYMPLRCTKSYKSYERGHPAYMSSIDD